MPRLASLTTQSLLGIGITRGWNLVRTIDNPNDYDTSYQDRFAYALAISGNYIIAGAPLEDEAGGTGSGKAYIFDVTTGNLLHTLDNPNAYDTSTADSFGSSVAMSGNRAIVSTPSEDDAGGTSSGKAYIYNVTTGALVHTLDNPNDYDTSAGDAFGRDRALEMDGDRAIIGAPFEDDAGGTSSGKAYIFNVDTGALVHTLDNPNPNSPSSSDLFAANVSISGNYAIAGAYGELQTGKAYIFNVTTGALVHTLDNPDADGSPASDSFGGAVAISGNYAIVGANFEDDSDGNNSGKAYIFDVTTGNLVRTLDNPNAYDTPAGDNFGSTVKLNGNYAIVGANYENDANGTESGKIYIFDVTTGDLLQTLDNPDADGSATNDRFGYTIATSDNYMVVGGYLESDAGGIQSGKMYIYKRS